jgi:hypothetical protein
MRVLIQTIFFILLVAQICFGQWMQVGLDDKSIKDIAVQNSNIFAVISDSSVYRSLDNGNNWTMIVDSGALDVALSPTGKVFMVKDTSGSVFLVGDLYYSLDSGETWIWVNILEQIADSTWWSGYPSRITVSPEGIVFCGLSQFVEYICEHLAKSTDDGLTWTTPGDSVLGGNLFDFRGQYVITDGVTSGWGSYGESIHLSSNSGVTWDYLGSAYPHTFPCLLGLFSNHNIIMGGPKISYWGEPKEVYISTDMCTTWTTIASINTQVGLSWSSGLLEGMLVGTEDSGVFLFSDEGDSLGSRNEGLTNLNVHALTLDNNGYIYAGTDNGVWRRPLSEVTSVEDNLIEAPSSYILSQNYPNPFNPNTKIKYSVPELSQVQIKVFDVLGNEIETFVNEEKPAGTYELTWYAESLPSGVYFYRIQAGDFIKTKKMLLLK